MVGIKHESMRKGQTSHKKEHNTRMCFPLKPVFTRDKGGLPNFIDEPIAGVDPAARDYIMQTILTNYDEKATILLSTHLISDIENILDEVIFIKEGEIICQKDADALRAEKGQSIDEIFREVFRC